MFSDLSSSLNLIFVIIAIAVNSLLALSVFHHNSRSATNRLYTLLSINISAWLLVNFFSVDASGSQFVLYIIRLTICLATPMSMLFYLLADTLPNESLNIKKRSLYWLLSLTFITMILSISPYSFISVELRNGDVSPIPGPGLIPFALFSTGFSGLAIWVLIQKFRKSSGIEKKQFQYIMYGILSMLGLIIITIFIPVTFFQMNFFVRLIPLYTLIFLSMTAYAIVKLQLFNIKIIAAEAFTVIICIALFANIFVSPTANDKVIAALVFTATLGFGLLLVKSIRDEVRAREQLQILSKELGDANEKLTVLDQAKTEFLSVASHQLRTPLTAIKGYLSMLLEGDFGKMSKSQKDTIEQVYTSANRLIHLINDMLDLSRIESGRMEFDFAATNLCEIIENVIEEITPKAKQKKLYLYFDNVNRSCPYIKADKLKIREVVMNLIDNAIKYTVEGGVTIQLLQVKDKLQLSIKDTGIGVDPKDQPKLFEKFFRTEAANEVTREGTGLGIYVVKKILEVHGGEIGFTSPGLNKGTTFYVNLPIPAGPIKAERVTVASLEAF